MAVVVGPRLYVCMQWWQLFCFYVILSDIFSLQYHEKVES